MAENKNKFKNISQRAKEHEKGMWGVIDDEVETLMDRKQKARLAILLGATALIAGVLTILALFL